jgi:monooxygenase
MLQRSPTYIVAYPDEDMFSNILKAIFPSKISYAITRFRNVLLQQWIYTQCKKFPKYMKKFLLNRIREYLSDEEIEKNFTPSYNPWEQRMCLVPNGDFFMSIKENKASVVTDEINNFTSNSIRLKSGKELEADLIVTATGLNLKLLGGVNLLVDGKKIEISSTMTYKSMMFSDVPNFISTFGYLNASWTLKADLTSQYACRLINLMDKKNYKYCSPRIPSNVIEDKNWLAADFSSGYIQRAKHLFPKQGNKAPWKNYQNYIKDWFDIKFNKLHDSSMKFYTK